MRRNRVQHTAYSLKPTAHCCHNYHIGLLELCGTLLWTWKYQRCIWKYCPFSFAKGGYTTNEKDARTQAALVWAWACPNSKLPVPAEPWALAPKFWRHLICCIHYMLHTASPFYIIPLFHAKFMTLKRPSEQGRLCAASGQVRAGKHDQRKIAHQYPPNGQTIACKSYKASTSWLQEQVGPEHELKDTFTDNNTVETGNKNCKYGCVSPDRRTAALRSNCATNGCDEHEPVPKKCWSSHCDAGRWLWRQQLLRMPPTFWSQTKVKLCFSILYRYFLVLKLKTPYSSIWIICMMNSSLYVLR